MRARSKIMGSLEAVYREAYAKAEATGDRGRMEALDFGFQRDQIILEVAVDVRDSLRRLKEEAEPESGLLDKAMALRRFAKPGR